MNTLAHATPDRPAPVRWRDPHRMPLELLEQEITELAAHIHVGDASRAHTGSRGEV